MRFFVLLPFLAALCLPCGTLADDDDDDDKREYREKRRAQRPGRDAKREHKVEFWEGGCKIKVELEDGRYKEERDCEGARRDKASRPAARLPAPAIVASPPVAARPPPIPAVVATVPAVAVRTAFRSPAMALGTAYPPWVVYQQGRVVYRAGQQPQTTAQAAGMTHCPSQSVGDLLGGVAGAVPNLQADKTDSRAMTPVGGGADGAMIGGSIGRRIDPGNQACVAKALEFAPTGQRIAWPDPGAPQYAVVPGRVERRGDRYCRQFDAEVLAEGGWQQTSGLACRRPDGVWLASR